MGLLLPVCATYIVLGAETSFWERRWKKKKKDKPILFLNENSLRSSPVEAGKKKTGPEGAHVSDDDDCGLELN